MFMVKLARYLWYKIGTINATVYRYLIKVNVALLLISNENANLKTLQSVFGQMETIQN